MHMEMAKQSDYLLELVKSIQGSVSRLESKQDDQTNMLATHTAVLDSVERQTKKTNGRVTKLEGDMSKVQGEVFGTTKAKDLPAWYRDPKVLQIIGYIALAGLLLVAAAVGFDITKINLGSVL